MAQMYKVFIDNKPIIFQINPQYFQTSSPQETWELLNGFLKSNETSITVQLSSQDDFEILFSEYEKIEAAGGMVQRDDRFLFIKRNGFWDIPKGKLEKGETPETGAVREVEEECGLVKPVIKEHLLNTLHTYVHKGKNVLKKTYWYWLTEGEIKTDLVPQAEEGITDVKYVLPSDWNEISSNTFLSIIEVMETLEKKIN